MIPVLMLNSAAALLIAAQYQSRPQRMTICDRAMAEGWSGFPVRTSTGCIWKQSNNNGTYNAFFTGKRPVRNRPDSVDAQLNDASDEADAAELERQELEDLERMAEPN